MDLAQEAPHTVILAADEASLYLQATLTSVWAPIAQTPIVATHPGREKVNFYGTLNLHTGSVIAQRAEKMNARTTASHLEQILAAVPDVPILLLWDRVIANIKIPKNAKIKFPTLAGELPYQHKGLVDPTAEKVGAHAESGGTIHDTQSAS